MCLCICKFVLCYCVWFWCVCVCVFANICKEPQLRSGPGAQEKQAPSPPFSAHPLVVCPHHPDDSKLKQQGQSVQDPSLSSWYSLDTLDVDVLLLMWLPWVHCASADNNVDYCLLDTCDQILSYRETEESGFRRGLSCMQVIVTQAWPAFHWSSETCCMILGQTKEIFGIPNVKL